MRLAALALLALPPAHAFAPFAGLLAHFGGAGSLVAYPNSTQVLPAIGNATTGQALYGHVAVYLPSSEQLLLIGGQIGESGTVITKEIRTFNLYSELLYGPRPTSVIPDNPSLDPYLSSTLPPHAWAAATVDTQERVWLIGGLTQDCRIDGAAYVLDAGGEGWTSPVASPRAPPRRRQAAAVAVLNATTHLDDIYVFGGIAEAWTCAGETIGYLGMDRWSTASTEVESIPWATPESATSRYEPPVSDYTASLLGDGASIAVVGGQTTDGVLAHMDEVLVFGTKKRAWSLQVIGGDVPTPRMGHVAVTLPTGAILVHGGLGLDREPLSDLHLLVPPLRYNPNSASASAWTWIKPRLSTHSMAPPARAWHSATLISNGQIVVAFGIDGGTGAVSSEIMLLSMTTTGAYSWTNSFPGLPQKTAIQAQIVNPKAVVPTPVVVVAPSPSAILSPVPILSPAAVSPLAVSTSAAPSPVDTPSSVAVPAPIVAPASPVPSVAPPETLVPGSDSTGPPPSLKLPDAPGSTASESLNPLTVSQQAEANARDAVSNAVTAKKTAIAAGSVGSLFALTALVGLGALFVRRRAAKKVATASTPSMDSTPTFAGPLVSTLMYTRARAGRTLSLGSTMSRPDLTHSFGTVNSNPFSDDNDMDELGQLPRSADMPVPPVPSTLASITSTLSAASYPYLSGQMHRTLSSDSDDRPSNLSVVNAGGSPRPVSAPPLFFDFLQPVVNKADWQQFMTAPIETGDTDRGIRPSPPRAARLPFALPAMPASSPFLGGLSSIGPGARKDTRPVP